MLKIWVALKGLLTAIALGIPAFFLGRWILDQLAALDPNVSASIVAAMAGLSGVLYSQRRAKAREIDAAHRERKAKLYSEFLELVFDMMAQSKTGPFDPENPPKDIEDRYMGFTRELLVWGSPKVIKGFERFKAGASADVSPHQIMGLVDELLQAIRKDLGNSNFGLSRYDLIKTFVRDPREVDEMIAKEDQT